MTPDIQYDLRRGGGDDKESKVPTIIRRVKSSKISYQGYERGRLISAASYSAWKKSKATKSTVITEATTAGRAAKRSDKTARTLKRSSDSAALYSRWKFLRAKKEHTSNNGPR